MNEIYFVTGNKGKVASANRYLSAYDIKANIIDLDTKEPEINDIYLIAKSKVDAAYKVLKEPCIANDSGFYIEGYPEEKNFPGAFVKRKLLLPLGIDGLIYKMNGIENRNCYFEDVVAFYDGNEYKLFNSISRGKISTSICGKDNSEQWSPLWHIFIPEGYNKTLSELTLKEREERNEAKTSALNEFAKWYSNSFEKRLK